LESLFTLSSLPVLSQFVFVQLPPLLKQVQSSAGHVTMDLTGVDVNCYLKVLILGVEVWRCMIAPEYIDMDSNNIFLLGNTLRYLRRGQLAAQISNRLRRWRENPARWRKRLTLAPPANVCWQPLSEFLAPGAQRNCVTAVLAGQLTFLNQARQSGWPPQWQDMAAPKLWQYNLHYFEWLWAFPESEFAAAKNVCRDWICRHPLDKAQVGWEPYPLALRLMNWCSFFYGQHRHQTAADPAFAHTLWSSIWQQGQWLSRHLEYHLLGNHLLEDAAALALLGSCFTGAAAAAAARWRHIGIKLLRQQLREQILADGMHFELSPMYQARMIYLLLLLYNSGDAELQQLCGAVLPRMLTALHHLTHPDGEIALFNDSAFAIYNRAAEFAAYAASLGITAAPPLQSSCAAGAWALPAAGYYGWRSAAGTYLACDVGNLGPDYIPGHAHADMLAFELSVRGQRIIVDSGVHDYEPGEARRYCRSTRAHNTVEIDAADQAQLWAAFRMARRGYCQDVHWQPAADGFVLSAAHTGYRRLPGKPVHTRRFAFEQEQQLTITDQVRSSQPVVCRARLHLHPQCRVQAVDATAVLIEPGSGGAGISIRFRGPGALVIDQATYHPEFYCSQTAPVLKYTWTNTATAPIQTIIIFPQV